VLAGAFNDGCGRVIGATVHDSRHVELTLKPRALPDTVCTQASRPWRQSFDLGPLPSGPHRTNITLHVLVPDSSRTGFEWHTYYGIHEFMVHGDCDSIAPPGPLPYVNRIVVGRDELCGSLPACPGDSIPILISGVFPHECLRLRGIQLIPSPATVVPTPPPGVRVIVDNGCCLGRPCGNIPTPWSATIKLPPRAPGDQWVNVELADVCCSETYPPGELHRTVVPFRVAGSCPPPAPCMTAGFFPASGEFSACDAFIAPGRSAELTFRVRSNVALAGLQGEFRVEPGALKIARIEPIGPAEGMLLDWSATPDGARFVLVSLNRAPIPPIPADSQRVGQGGWPVLRVVLDHAGTGEIPGRTTVTPGNLLGSDKLGQAVYLCPPPPCASFDRLLAPGRGVVCAERACDFNSDGLQDVRDLVLMVGCMNQPEVCPPDAVTRYDCDGDSTFAIADVICCARHVLRRPRCPDCPPDTGAVRREPRVTVRIGTPEGSADGIALPVLFAGADRLGGAMLTFDAPLDRYDVASLDVSQPGNWIVLHEVRDGRLILGVLGIGGGDGPGVPGDLRVTLRLVLKPGHRPGGEVAVMAGEFSGPDGVALEVSLGRPAQPLPGAGQVTLGAGHPNPFSTETAFTLDLVAQAEVTVGIYDLRGRAVATLHRAPLGPGPHRFRWDGRHSDGSAAPDGIYFYQATVGGRSLARKIILMRGD
jgi:hypothetical protein